MGKETIDIEIFKNRYPEAYAKHKTKGKRTSGKYAGRNAKYWFNKYLELLEFQSKVKEQRKQRQGCSPIIRKAVWTRSGGYCEMCERASAKHIHHVDMNRTNNDLNNLSHVCVPCHESIHKRKIPKLNYASR